MSALVCGALAFDTLMRFEGRFREQILPDKLDALSVSFPVPEMRREFGGCAGNIVYNLSLLGEIGRPVCAVGHDFAPYAAWMDDCDVDQAYVRELDDAFTAQGFITTDLDGNQITAFHPGAMAYDAVADLPPDTGASLGVIAPDGPEPMWRAAQYFADSGIPFLFDPGQHMTALSATQMHAFVDAADWVALNRYEAELLSRGTGRTLADLSRSARALVVTHGVNGSTVWREGKALEVPAVVVSDAVDPTGGGDAYRAGLVYGLMRYGEMCDRDWLETARIASVMGALAVECHGTQNHRSDRDELARRYKETYGQQWAG